MQATPPITTSPRWLCHLQTGGMGHFHLFVSIRRPFDQIAIFFVTRSSGSPSAPEFLEYVSDVHGATRGFNSKNGGCLTHGKRGTLTVHTVGKKGKVATVRNFQINHPALGVAPSTFTWNTS